jgi:hypothetical protein
LAKRIATNLSAKHWEILENLSKKYTTQRKALEYLLENADKGSAQLSKEDEIKLQFSRNKTMVIIPKVCFRYLMEGKLIEAMQAAVDGTEMAVEELLRRPFKDCSLKEVIECLMEMSMAYNLITSWKLTDYPKEKVGERGKGMSLGSENGNDDYDYSLSFYHNEGELYGNVFATVIERCIQKKGAITHVSPNQQFGVFLSIKESWQQEVYSPVATPVAAKNPLGKKGALSVGEGEREEGEQELVQEQTARGVGRRISATAPQT